MTGMHSAQLHALFRLIFFDCRRNFIENYSAFIVYIKIVEYWSPFRSKAAEVKQEGNCATITS